MEKKGQSGELLKFSLAVLLSLLLFLLFLSLSHGAGRAERILEAGGEDMIESIERYSKMVIEYGH